MKNITFTVKNNVIKIDGTGEAIDLLTTIDCRKDKKGFHNGCMKAAEYILPKVLTKLDKYEKVIIMGHSMGGSIAQCLAWLLRLCNFKVQLDICEAYPACPKLIVPIEGLSIESNNDPIPLLFRSRFHYPCEHKHVGVMRTFFGTLKQIFILRRGDHVKPADVRA